MGGSLMIPALTIVAMVVLLVLLFLFMTGREEVEEQSSAAPDDQTQHMSPDALHPSQLVRRIFSREDRDFILRTHSPRLQRIYQRERRKVALHWVHQTSREVSRIMRIHRLSSRQSPDLHVATEANLFFQYFELRLLCGLLVFLIKLVGPHSLADLASYSGDLYYRFGGAVTLATAPIHAASAESSAP
jgi:hypothetical protein